jgi:hypothetical protein
MSEEQLDATVNTILEGGDEFNQYAAWLLTNGDVRSKTDLCEQLDNEVGIEEFAQTLINK